MTTRDNRDYISVLLYSYYTTITGWGVLLSHNVICINNNTVIVVIMNIIIIILVVVILTIVFILFIIVTVKIALIASITVPYPCTPM